MRQISDSAIAAAVESAGLRIKKSSGVKESGCVADDTCGAMAAVTAAVVPIFRASRRVIFSGMAMFYSSGAIQPPVFLWRTKARAQPARRHSNDRAQNRACRRPSLQLFLAPVSANHSPPPLL